MITGNKNSNPAAPHAVVRLVLWHQELKDKHGDSALRIMRGDVWEPGHKAAPECEKQLVLSVLLSNTALPRPEINQICSVIANTQLSPSEKSDEDALMSPRSPRGQCGSGQVRKAGIMSNERH